MRLLARVRRSSAILARDVFVYLCVALYLFEHCHLIVLRLRPQLCARLCVCLSESDPSPVSVRSKLERARRTRPIQPFACHFAATTLFPVRSADATARA